MKTIDARKHSQQSQYELRKQLILLRRRGLRRLAAQEKDVKLIIVPLQKLSDKHLAMRRMLTSGNMFFVNDERWRKENLAKNLRLPLFVNNVTSKL